MTAPRPGDPFRLDLDGTLIVGRYIEVEPPYRLVIEWDRQGTGTATPVPTIIEITLTPKCDRTNVKVEFTDMSAKDPAFLQQLGARYLDRIAAALTDAERAHGN